MRTVNKYQNHLKEVRMMAWALIVLFCMGLFSPAVSIAGGGGPTQPEVQGFTPIGVSEMVDPFTGDFSYNIPLMDVEGYPINIAYSSGVSMDQEASWVGLGWNLNMGSVVRSMRGLPDDFNGDNITKVHDQKAEVSTTVGANASFELFGKNLPEDVHSPYTFGAGISFSYSNYYGFGADLNFGPSFKTKTKSGLNLNYGCTFTGSSENGAGFSPSFGLSKATNNLDGNNTKLTGTVSSPFNSRAGLQAISYNITKERSYAIGTTHVVKRHDEGVGIGGSMGSSFSLGTHTYSPTANSSFLNQSISGNFSFGSSFIGADVPVSLHFLVNINRVDPDLVTQTNPAYGCFNLEAGQFNERALLDFNRDNDGAFTKYTPNLPSAYLTSDIFQVQAQGIGGSYKTYRNEVGYVFDPKSVSRNSSGNIGLEFGTGNTVDFGIDLTYNHAYSESGAWTGNTNQASDILTFQTATGITEEFALQEANEKAVDIDHMFSTQFNGTAVNHLLLEGSAIFPHLEDKIQISNDWTDLTDNARMNRIKRNQLLTFLSVKDVQDGFGLNAYRSDIYSGAQPHHIGEMTQLGTDGRRYVFGIPAYNHLQKDVTFATGSSASGPGFGVTDIYKGLINLGSSFNSVASPGNDRGLDNYFSSETTPAYAHAFLLTAVLSDDYSDSDGEKGPSVNDMGSYVKFDYSKVDNFKWRTPMEENSAYHNEVMKTTTDDDKGSYVYGEKDMWYVKAVETKNYIAIFTLEDRKDGISAKGEQGGLDPSSGKMKLLKKITLYAKPDYEANGVDATPIQEVHFVYDYSLCSGYPGNINGGGKLTLKQIYFTYQGSYKMKRSSYKFDYANNPVYGMKNVDRWGNYQPQTVAASTTPSVSALTSGDFPYTIQDPAANANASAWLLSDIHLPSGGKIHVDYESDDYAYVQHLQASQMYPICAAELDNATTMDPSCLNGSDDAKDVSTDGKKNRAIYFKLKPGHEDVKEYATVGQPIYFKVLSELADGSGGSDYEYVSGYATISELSVETYGGQKYGRIKLDAVKLKDNDGSTEYSPITKAAILFGRLHLSRSIYNSNISPNSNDQNGVVDFGHAVLNSITSLSELATGPNKHVYNQDYGKKIKMNKSFVRLLEPTGHKFGGGSRVSMIKIFDNWDYMVGHESPGDNDGDLSYTYGQKFDYTLPDGRSSGVACYEPLLGGDENTWRSPLFYDNKFRLAPDENLFLEDPVMESQFPSASVGYSRVTITDIKPEDYTVNRTATGKVVKEFYTAKDFPTIVKTSVLETKAANSFLPLLPQYDYLTASQGFTIELNDMHGKPKSETVYGEGQEKPLSSVRYEYQSNPITYKGVACFELTNKVAVINKDGSVSNAELGVKNEAVADFRQNITSSIGGSVDVNFNSFILGIPLAVPSIWPSVDISESRFRSATLSKVINKFGIQSRVSANQDGSIVETNNLAYDSETGQVLATQTTTDFNDKIYSVNYPAHWKYEQMGMAYKNIGYTIKGYPAGLDGFVPVSGSANYFVEGDEVKVMANGFTTPKKGWVIEVTPYGIRIVDENGNAISGTNTEITIIRSGRRNNQGTTMSSITSLDNPLSGVSTGIFTKVLNAGAVEFKQDWGTFCNCFEPDRETGTITTNPYVTGSKGVWRPVKSYTYLTNRSQTSYNTNTNIRRDGVFTSFSPFHQYYNGAWTIFGSNWTFVSEVTNFSPNGSVLETRDALGRYSASLFSYKNTLTTAVAANSKRSQLAEASFEDVAYRNCTDQSLFSTVSSEDLSTNQAHTGRTSIYVSPHSSLQFSTTAPLCVYDKGCDLSIVATGQYTYQVNSGTSNDFALTQTSVSGTATAVITPAGAITVTPDPDHKYFELILTITNQKQGCTMTVRITSVPPGNTQLSMEIISQTQN